MQGKWRILPSGMSLISQHFSPVHCFDTILNLSVFLLIRKILNKLPHSKNCYATQQLIHILIWSVENDGEKQDRVSQGREPGIIQRNWREDE